MVSEVEAERGEVKSITPPNPPVNGGEPEEMPPLVNGGEPEERRKRRATGEERISMRRYLFGFRPGCEDLTRLGELVCR
jgi:hypothetical protein